LDKYYEYTISVRLGDEKVKHFKVFRRFSQFEELLEYLKINYPGAFLPHLPPKPLSKNMIITDDKEFLEERRRSLDLMMKKLLSHHCILGGSRPDSILMTFLDPKETLSQSSRVTKMTKNIVGKASIGFAKSKSYLKSWFTSSS
jgi:hypothetical protein